MTDVQLSLFDPDGAAPRPIDDGESKNGDLTPDGEARAFAVDPRNNVVLEAPSSRLRSVGLTTVHYSADKLDHLFWYRLAGTGRP